MSDTNLEVMNIEELLNASMDDLEDLPPMGVPPSGHYNLTTSFDIETVGEGKSARQLITASYVVDAVNELKDEDEASEVAVGQQFKEFFHLVKRDGTRNSFGIGTLKERLAPHKAASGIENIGELIASVKQVAIAASVKRKVNKSNEDQYNLQLSDIIIL